VTTAADAGSSGPGIAGKRRFSAKLRRLEEKKSGRGYIEA
jgi:hypothetical protein